MHLTENKNSFSAARRQKIILIPEYNYFMFFKAVSWNRAAFHFMGENVRAKWSTVLLLKALQSYLWNLLEC